MKSLNSVIGLFFCLALSSSVFAQTTTQSKAAGAWTASGTWTNGVPSTSSLNNVVLINRAVTFNSGSITGYGSTSITIQSGGSLTVTGDLYLTGSGVSLTIQSGGSLTVSGTTTVYNGATITVNSGATSVDFGIMAARSAGKFMILPGGSATGSSYSSTSNSDAILDNRGTLTINGTVDVNGVVTNSGTMNVTSDYTQENSGNQTTNSGNLNVSGNTYAYGLIQLNPGVSASSNMIINGTLTIKANPWMIVGTTVSGTCGATITYYADLIVKTDVNLIGSGDITVKQNGRFVVYGNLYTSGGSSGDIVTIDCGGQAYVNGYVNIGTGGGNTVLNNNTSGSPQTGSDGQPIIGLYVNGTTTDQTTTGTVGTKSQLQSNDNVFYSWIRTLPNNPLPVVLLYFSVKKTTETAIELTWATASERNFDYFEIEKSADGKTFSKIGQVQGHGTTSEQHVYEFGDAYPVIGKNYYRLKSVDFDGYTETFFVITSEFSGAEGISIYPNPLVDHNLHVDLNFETENATEIKITDIYGVPKLTAFSNDMQTNISLYMDAGIYFVIVTNGSVKKVSRLVIK